MTTDESARQLLEAISEIRDCVRLMAEPAIAQRDRNLRAELRSIVGKSKPGAKAVFLMDGSRNQAAIGKGANMQKGNLSTLVKKLNERKLLQGDVKQPKLAISIPPDFFENGTRDE